MTEDDAVSSLRKAYRRGTLDVVVGAGASIGAGLPNWDELNARLLRFFLGEQYKDLEFQATDLAEVAAVFVQHFGREAVVDLVRKVSEEPTYRRMLRKALYGGGAKDVSILHYELAALMDGSPGLGGVHTFNFDDLIERAAYQLTGVPPHIVIGGQKLPAKGPYVRHLHGFLPESGRASPLLVLSERDYQRARSGPDQDFLEHLMLTGPRRTVLLVGLSLTDPRLRGVLLKRFAKRVGKEVPEVIALVSGPTAQADGLIQRLAGTFVARQEVAYWEDWPVRLVRIGQHARLPLTLRRVRLGDDARAWTRAGHRFLQRNSPDFGGLYRRQSELVALLRPILEFLRRRYAVPADEELELGAFVPRADGTLQLGLRCSLHPRAQPLSAAHAQTRTLAIHLRKPQGAAGAILVGGYPMRVDASSSMIDQNFSAAMRADWNQDRVFASMLCVPVYDSAEWVPTGLVYLSSNSPEPFWGRFKGASQIDRLFAELRNLYVQTLEIRSAVVHEGDTGIVQRGG